MNDFEVIANMDNLDSYIRFIEFYFVALCAHIMYVKINNIREISKWKYIIIVGVTVAVSLILEYIDKKIGTYYKWIMWIALDTLINKVIFKKEIIYTILSTVVSIVTCYLLFCIAFSIDFFIFVLINVKNDYINLFIILLVYFFLVYKFLKTKKIKNGVDFLINKLNNTYFSMTLFIICIMLIFLNIIVQELSKFEISKIGFSCAIFSICMIITAKESFGLYYRYNQLNKNLQESKDEIEKKDMKIKELEESNLKYSKSAHSLNHRYNVLEYKVNKNFQILLAPLPKFICKLKYLMF